MTRKQFTRKRNTRHAFIYEWIKSFGDACHYCGLSMTEYGRRCDLSSLTPTIDHVVPVSRGGPILDHDNWQVVCFSCNNLKATMDHYEFLVFLEAEIPSRRQPMVRQRQEPSVATLADIWPVHMRAESQKERAASQSA